MDLYRINLTNSSIVLLIAIRGLNFMGIGKQGAKKKDKELVKIKNKISLLNKEVF